MKFETNFWSNRKVVPYARHMQSDRVSLEIKIDLKKPVAIEDFIATFEGFGGQFERYLRALFLNAESLSGIPLCVDLWFPFHGRIMPCHRRCHQTFATDFRS